LKAVLREMRGYGKPQEQKQRPFGPIDLEQRAHIDFAGFEIDALEVIGGPASVPLGRAG
jgi:hypothetical protein